MAAESCCCSTSGGSERASVIGNAGQIGTETSSSLSWRDRVGFFKSRWGIGRMHYAVAPGLYRIGKPDDNSPVLVTANYKMTFDEVRQELRGIHAWILVLDTHGVNVWCAAGKGTFGTDELVQRIETSHLKTVVAHREVILPQLGAPGVAAHLVAKRTGFKVIYGPVYARDLRDFLAKGKRATPSMRRVRFLLKDRMAVIPMELIPALKWTPVIVALILMMRLMEGSGVAIGMVGDVAAYLGAIVMGSVVFPMLIPWIPARSFAVGGWFLGMIWALLLAVWLRPLVWVGVSNLLVLPAIVAYLALNFTGATTFTSPSGVRKEIRNAAPVMVGFAVVGMIVRAASRLWI